MEFLDGYHLNSAIVDIIMTAEHELLLVSPYIKLHERVLDALQTLSDKPHVRVTVIYGKASGDKTTTFDKSSIKFLKTLPNIEILHRQNLHAKFYANENASILCSMNLYAYSHDTNVEAGYIIDEHSPRIAREAQEHARDYFYNNIVNGADSMFNKQAEFESRFLRSDQYLHSDIILDNLDNKSNTKSKKKDKTRPSGYCIASGKAIPFNLEKPLSRNEFKRWIEETDGGDMDYPMNYCHFSGEKSNGKTTFDKPILHKNWKTASKNFDL